MKYLVPAITCIFMACQALTAQAIRARVTDSITGAPVPYAAIQYGPGMGVITNEEGYFQLSPGSEPPVLVTISCLGYEDKQILLNQLPPEGAVIRLQESAVQLSEVFLSNKPPDADVIMARVRKRIGDNYPSRARTHRLFSRQTEYVDLETMDFEVTRASEVSREGLRKTNRELDSLAGAIMQAESMHFKDYLGDFHRKDEKTSKLHVIQATSLEDSKNGFSVENIQERAQHIALQYLDTTQTYKLKTGILKIEDSLDLNGGFNDAEKPLEYDINSLRSTTQNLLNTSQFHEDAFLQQLLEPREYDFTYEKATFLQDELIYILDFKPAKGRSKYTGKVFVHANDYALLKVNYRYAEGKRGKKVNLKLVFGVKYVEDTEHGTILFRKGEDGAYEPSYVQRTRGNYFYINRPVKFIQNSAQKEKVTFNFTVAGNSRNKEELLVTATSALGDTYFQALEEGEKAAVIALDKYDATLWQDEETLEPLEEMRQFNALQ